MHFLESPGNLLTLVIKFSFKTIVCSIIFGLFRKGLLLQLLCIWETWKNLSKSWKSPGKLFVKKGTNPAVHH